MVASMTQPSVRGASTVSGRRGALALAALGVVFGDIGTSPLYTLKTVLSLTGAHPPPEVVLGMLSLVFWTLTLVTTVKYVGIALRIDNEGEGGILALMSLLGIKRQNRPLIVAIGLLGAALIYGDGAITPAISVLSAVEGLDIAVPALHPYVLPAAAGVLIALFLLQPLGTAHIGRAFGPVMALWFASIAALGLWGVLRHPAVFAALDPQWGLRYLLTHGRASFLVLGGVFLCVTGAEALYADLGHFGRAPIRFAWLALVFPALLLNYAGQAALVLDGASTEDNIFFRLCPPVLLLPLIVLATAATVIASQAIITGAFSMTRQAIQLGWMPRLWITQTSASGYGQIYVGSINWILGAVTLALTLAFGKSDNLAAAYGIAVSLTMLMTSVLLYLAMREIWHWSLPAALATAGSLLLLDVAFVGANLMKVMEGGWVPLALAALVYAVMLIWHRGTQAVVAATRSQLMPITELLELLRGPGIARVAGTAVFVTRTSQDVPAVMRWHLEKDRALHETVVILTLLSRSVPWIREAERLSLTEIGAGVWRGTAVYGFMERVDIPRLLADAAAGGCALPLDDVVYYVGHDTIVSAGRRSRLLPFERAAFAAMVRNAVHLSRYLHLPPERVVEVGRQIAV